MLLDEGTGSIVEGSANPDAEASVTLLGGEPTVHAFSPEKVEQATRFEYRADASGVVFALVVSGEALKSPALIQTVARQIAAQLNEDRQVPGVVDMEETQIVSPLGSLDDVWNVAITSTNGKVTQIVTFQPLNMRPDLFAQTVAYWRGQLDRYG